MALPAIGPDHAPRQLVTAIEALRRAFGDRVRLLTGQVTLAAAGTTTEVAAPAIRADTRVLLFPASADAASAHGLGTYVSARDAGTGFTLTHSEHAGARIYDWLAIV